ncbi:MULTISPECIES: type II toxin-antitoxin system HicB family antitoxin [unclassified Lactobacillus]|uniref:type II toxin-antitoxin system HicB family antitoxin n=1 Tax=unclassified Lactobacillus TaxID=2620435 RepID=UPI0023F77A53|nr:MULTISPECIES: type II toxin-antitoxin system HicB family antitoxin [unclassified Lactobacillus]MDF7668847.1 type II toxin-antitoxin system HicB family antitoxin [Lactobacillus sp. ESL0703]WEV38458.1 type II toxin-antitoxin system HicB family antitoxin [Lactobacillus sp. ESL0680]
MDHRIVTYPAIFKPLDDNFYVISFPDVKGAITEGEGLRESLKMAADTLASRLYDKAVLPKCSALDEIDPGDDGSFVALVSADLTEASRDRINYEI